MRRSFIALSLESWFLPHSLPCCPTAAPSFGTEHGSNFHSAAIVNNVSLERQLLRGGRVHRRDAAEAAGSDCAPPARARGPLTCGVPSACMLAAVLQLWSGARVGGEAGETPQGSALDQYHPQRRPCAQKTAFHRCMSHARRPLSAASARYARHGSQKNAPFRIGTRRGRKSLSTQCVNGRYDLRLPARAGPPTNVLSHSRV